jgi:hypothetical protein
MAAPRQDPDTGGRSLAEILREAGIESPTRGRRRRWDDADDTGIRQRRPEAETDDTGGIDGRPFGRRAGDLRIAGPTPADADPSTAAIPGLRPSGKPDVPAATAAAGAVRERRPEDPGAGDRRPGDRREGERRREERRPFEPRADRRAGDRPAATPPREERRPERGPTKAAPVGDNPSDAPSTGPIPVVADDLEVEDLDATPRESAFAWLRFGGELVIALAAGVGIYFLFTVIWEMLPHLAMLVAPLAVTGLVAAVGAYRHKMSRGPVGPKLLAVLVFAGTLLTVAPAAGLLAAG